MRSLRFAVMAVATPCLVLTSLVPAPAGEQPANGVNPVEGGQEIGAGAGHPGTTRIIDISNNLGRGSGPDDLCMGGVAGEWQRWGSRGWHASLPEPGRRAGLPGDAEFWFLLCPPLAGFETPGIERGHWSSIGAPDPPPPAADLAVSAWAYVRGLLIDPAITLAPPEIDTEREEFLWSPLVNLPTFVTIANPQPSTIYTASRGGVDVWIAVIPAVTLNPGEPDAPAAIPCDDDGTRYDPGGALPNEQAEVDGACAHIYRNASPEGDPWDGKVTITWNVTWGSNQAGQNGAFDVVPNESGFQRIVYQLEAVITRPGDL